MRWIPRKKKVKIRRLSITGNSKRSCELFSKFFKATKKDIFLRDERKNSTLSKVKKRTFFVVAFFAL